MMKIVGKLGGREVVWAKLGGGLDLFVLGLDGFFAEKVGGFRALFGGMEGEAESGEEVEEKDVPLVCGFEEEFEEVALIGVNFQTFEELDD